MSQGDWANGRGRDLRRRLLRLASAATAMVMSTPAVAEEIVFSCHGIGAEEATRITVDTVAGTAVTSTGTGDIAYVVIAHSDEAVVLYPDGPQDTSDDYTVEIVRSTAGGDWSGPRLLANTQIARRQWGTCHEQ